MHPGRSRLRLGAAIATAAWLALGAAAISPGPAQAQPSPGEAAEKPRGLGLKVALLHLDALGMDAERVARLEALFRNELGRLAGQPVPGRREIARALRGSKLGQCAGETSCLAAIGRKLEVDLVISGNVAELGDAYVVHIKSVDPHSGEEIRRIDSDPLRGDADELIDAVRVAAHRLLAPDRLTGSVLVLSDRDGAQVELGGEVVGTTPLSRPIRGLPLGVHTLRVSAPGFIDFASEVTVRFQKTTRVVVTLGPDPLRPPPPATDELAERAPRWYQKRWVQIGAGAALVAFGGYLGHRLARDRVVSCPMAEECR